MLDELAPQLLPLLSHGRHLRPFARELLVERLHLGVQAIAHDGRRVELARDVVQLASQLIRGRPGGPGARAQSSDSLLLVLLTVLPLEESTPTARTANV